MQNAPLLKGRLKLYHPSRNIDHLDLDTLGEINNIKRNKTVICLRKNRNLEIDTNNGIPVKGNKKNKLSLINNKSSNCITPGSFNPLINYKVKEKKYRNINGFRYYKNQDHFFHMNPTEIYIYKPQLKRTFNGLSFSRNEKVKKTGKKLFCLKNVESKDGINDRNSYKKNFKYLSNTINNNFAKNLKIYEYDAPAISYKDVYKKN